MTEYRFTSKDEREQQKVEAERVAREKLAAEREEATQKRQAEQTAWLETFDFIPEVRTICTELIKANGGSAEPVESWKGVPYTKGSYTWAVTLPDRSPFKIELIARDGLTQWFSAEDWPAHANLQEHSYLHLENATLDVDLLEKYLEKATGLRVQRT